MNVESIDLDKLVSSEKVWTIADPTPSCITFFSPAHIGGEILKIAPDGFYVRGVKIEQGPGEAQAVYDAFLSFLQCQHFKPESRGVPTSGVVSEWAERYVREQGAHE